MALLDVPPGTLEAPTLEIPIPNVTFTSISDPNNLSIPWIGQYVSGVYTFAISIVGLVAAVMMIIGGFQYLTSGGDNSKVAAGKKRILDAMIGMVMALGSYVILFTINPELVQFKSLGLFSVQTESYDGHSEARTDTSLPEPTGGIKPGSCADAGYHLTDPLLFDQKLNEVAISGYRRNLVQKYPQMVAVYKNAQNVTGVPWQVLAAVHYGEGGNNPKQSILNGNYTLCNSNDDPPVARLCTECQQAKTIENDIICGARILQNNLTSVGFGKMTTEDTVANYDLIKLAMCRLNGCYRSQFACPEATPYVAARFDERHMAYPAKSAHDCISPQCNPSAPPGDATVQKRVLTGSCTIKLLPTNAKPAFTPSDSLCNSNMSEGSCCKSNGDNTLTCTYTPTTYSGKTNPCGAGIFKQNLPDRPGAFVGYGIVKLLEKNGEIH